MTFVIFFHAVFAYDHILPTSVRPSECVILVYNVICILCLIIFCLDADILGTDLTVHNFMAVAKLFLALLPYLIAISSNI